MTKKEKLLAAAVAGIALGVSAPRAAAQGKVDEVKCWGVNGCGSHAKCAVKDDDLGAVKKLLGEREYTKRFGKSEAHACGSHAKCGASSEILNWTTTTAGECSAQGGFLIEAVGGRKVAKKA
jgi:hypothetical protein